MESHAFEGSLSLYLLARKMDEEVRAIGNESALKSGKGRIQVSLLDDTVVAFQIEVSFFYSHSYFTVLAFCHVLVYISISKSVYFDIEF